MIPKNVREGAEATGLTGEKAYFTIKPNGKAFRTLIDGLYSNKVRAVIRELCSNAHDSHIAAGQTNSFLVGIPTHLDPVFRVRDYGTGLTHDQVMHLYTTIFESTKEETNEQTGQLGLGSKSPFAYTDSFQVTVWTGIQTGDGPITSSTVVSQGEKRSYIAYLERDGVPSITHVGTEPSNEPRGIEVSFPAEREDIRQFQREMQFVSMGYTPAPTVEGMEIAIPTPRLSGEGWAIYAHGAFGDDIRGRHFVRQGSAVYPNDQYPFPNLGHAWISVVDIPIGTADVTASREALSYDRDTIMAVQSILRLASDDLKGQVEALIDAAQTRIEKAKVFATYNGVFSNIKGSVKVSLHDDGWKTTDGIAPGALLEQAKHFGKARQQGYSRSDAQRDRFKDGFEYQDIAKVRIIINDTEVKMVRRYKRIRLAAESNYWTYVLDVEPKDRRKAIKRIKKYLELTDDKFVLASSLPDCPPETIKRAPSTRRELPAGAYWMPRIDGKIKSPIFGNSPRRDTYNWPYPMLEAARMVGISLDWDKTFFVNAVQQAAMEKRGELPANRRLDVVIRKAQEKMLKAEQPKLDAVVAYNVLEMHLDRYNAASKVIKDRFFPTINKPANVEKIIMLANSLRVDLQTLPIHAKITAEIESLIERFPLCFRTSDPSHFEQYIDAIQATA